MKGRWTGLALVLAVGTAPAFADNARPRGGGSSGGGHSAGSSHHSGGGGGQRSGGGSSHSGSSGGGVHPRSGAEARHPRAGTGTGPRYYRGYGHGYYGYGYPYYGYSPYYYNYWPYWGSSYWYSPYYYGGGYGYGGYGYGPDYSYGYSDESGAVRTFVEPAETKIHVDGRYAGTADDFDGLMQRLYVSPGAHEVMLSLEGYKTHRVKVYLSPGGTLKLHYDMVKGSGEDAQIDTLGNPEDERFGKRQRRYDAEDDDADADVDEVRRDDRRPPDEGAADARGTSTGKDPRAGLSWGNELGTVRLAIQPGDATVYVDGRFRGPANGIRSLRLSPGTHHIEVVRPGFRTEERDVDVKDGEDTTLELELSRS